MTSRNNKTEYPEYLYINDWIAIMFRTLVSNGLVKRSDLVRSAWELVNEGVIKNEEINFKIGNNEDNKK